MGTDTIDLSDADLLERGYERIAKPLTLHGWFTKRTRNPFDVADGDIGCYYCKFCDDYLPDSDGARLCDHVIWCDECSDRVYDLPQGHVSIDSSDATPTRHDEGWVRGEADECEYPHNGSIRLRINDGYVETSNGRSIPVAEAARVIADITDRRNKQLRLFGPTPKQIFAFGARVVVTRKVVRVGCTQLAWDEVKRIAAMLGEMELVKS